MAFGDLSVLSALRTAMTWRQTRQRVLAENIANANTVGFQPRDLKPLDADRLAGRTAMTPSFSARLTDARHIAAGPLRAGDPALEERAGGFETTPDGNGVVLEEQMMKLTNNQLDYEIATTLYQRGLGLIKTAIGRRA